MQRSNDIVGSFEQEANFWWLTGIEKPDWWLIIDGARDKSWLVLPEMGFKALDVNEEIEKARICSGVNDVLTYDAGILTLRELSKKHSIVRTLSEQPRNDRLNYSLNPAPRRMYDMLNRIFNSVQDCRRDLAHLRSIKQPEEISRIKKAINLTVEGFEQMRSKMNDVRYEYEVEAMLTYYYRMRGARVDAYDPVVASGARACDLTYIANDGRLKKRETLLVDAGVRLTGYVAGVTRSYAYGEPTRRHVAIHQAIDAAQKRIIDLLEPDVTFDYYRHAADDIMQETLMSLGLMADKNDISVYRRYFPHTISHGVGVDVHDSLGTFNYLQPGMILTVEPGVYIPEEKVGMRVGDTILITPAGHVNLSERLSTDL